MCSKAARSPRPVEVKSSSRLVPLFTGAKNNGFRVPTEREVTCIGHGATACMAAIRTWNTPGLLVVPGAAADCESIRSGLWGQPVNSATTLVFVGVGLWLLRSRPWTGTALVATGLGSFLFHGPMPSGNEWAHDFTLVWLLAVMAGEGTRFEKLSRLPGLVIIAVTTAVLPITADPIAVVLTVAILWFAIQRRPVPLGPLLLIGVAGIYGRLGATGGLLCDPASIWQPHAVWHLGAAAAVGWLGLRTPLERTPRL